MSFENLKVFQKAYDLSLAIHRRSLDFPSFEQRELASQLRRSSKSICANLGEGMGKRMSPRDILKYLRTAIGSCDETRLWLRYARDLGYLEPAAYADLHEAYCEVGKMLTGLVKHWSAQL